MPAVQSRPAIRQSETNVCPGAPALTALGVTGEPGLLRILPGGTRPGTNLNDPYQLLW